LDPQPLDKGPISKSNKLRLNVHVAILERKSLGLKPKEKKKKQLKRRAHDLKNQDASYGPRQSPTQVYNLLQVSSN
jgi:hypothetical protein